MWVGVGKLERLGGVTCAIQTDNRRGNGRQGRAQLATGDLSLELHKTAPIAQGPA